MAMTMDEVRAEMDRATGLYNDRQWQEASVIFTDLLLEPEALQGSNDMHWNLAMCLAHLGDLALAEQHVQAGGHSRDEFHSRFARSQYDDAVKLYHEGRWDEAAEGFIELLLLPGYDATGMNDAHWNIGMCLARQGDLAGGLEHARAGGHSEQEFRAAAAAAGVEGADAEADARRKLQEATELYQAQRWSEAADAFTDLLIMPGLPADGMEEVHWNIGMCFARLGDWERAFGHVRAQGGNENEFRQTCIDAGLNPPNPT